MPITKSAKKSLRASLARAVQNRQQKTILEKALKKVSKDNVSETISQIDKAAKNHLISKNKAGRLKSRLAKKFSPPKKLKTKKKN